MSLGLETTFRLLSETTNEAAVPVLVAGLDSSCESIRRQSLVALLLRRNPIGGREILRRFDALCEEWGPLLERYAARLSRSIRDALLGNDLALFVTACRASVWFRDFDMIPVLLSVLDSAQGPTAPLAARCLATLVETLHQQIDDSHTGETPNPQHVRPQVLSALGASLQRFGRHRCREVIEGFLLLTDYNNAVLQQILHDSHDPAYATTIDILTRSDRAAVVTLLLDHLDHVRAPGAVLTVMARRSDPMFVGCLLRKVARGLSPPMRLNIRRIESLAWLRCGADYLDQFDELAQVGAVRMMMASGVPRDEVFDIIRRVLICGKPAARRVAAETLGEFHGAEANNLAIQSLDDPDPHVQATIVGQMRSRGIPGILARLVEMVDSPHPEVRQAVQQSLDEFSFARFLAAFDALDDEVRQSTGALVRKVDSGSPDALREELRSPVRTRRQRALRMVQAMNLSVLLAPAIIALLEDEDHVIRAEAAAALADCECEASLEALRRAREDHSITVRETAGAALERRGDPQEAADARK